ncbi:MAG: type II toxin-antitoxin system HicB family antitoxin [Coraliomargarita sp.]
MKFKVVVHQADEGGYWGEVPSIPGCASQGETMEELKTNILDAIRACLSVEVSPPENDPLSKVIEIAV